MTEPLVTPRVVMVDFEGVNTSQALRNAADWIESEPWEVASVPHRASAGMLTVSPVDGHTILTLCFEELTAL